MRCPFCTYRGPSPVLRDFVDVFVIEPLAPVTPGHLLVIPRRHVVHLGDDPGVAARVAAVASILVGGTGSWNVITSIGREATQTVMHLHLHLVPRHEGDGLKLPWDAPASPEVMALLGVQYVLGHCRVCKAFRAAAADPQPHTESCPVGALERKLS